MAVKIQDVSVIINNEIILDKISGSIPRGKVTSIIGPNGAGKSTLLRAVGGISNNYSGHIFIDGQDIKRVKRRDFARKLAILPQGMQVPADITVKRLVDYGRFPYRSWFTGNKGEDEAAVNWAMEETKVAHLAERQLVSLSGGERQRAWIAMALAQKPEILLLDEPTTYLDISHQLEVMEIVSRLNKTLGLTVAMVLHDLNQAVKYSDNLMVIKDKGIYASGNPADIMDEQLLREVFGVRVESYINNRGEKILSPVAVVK
ncbi:MAG: ABC transporter ATP-binding protein [Anaerovibrio sp.]|uniref:ABC transporter ATP-binding protein n=1 Tax=Anaerovibrio sp. TaxID=1872532 RepID=UPI0025F941C6|nr:ABC transporter ATP-binding protein [Anaerovibrio sp.]MCR5176780.1 ABC transporter ATP-binding protein [Anaerovibrio sp.]